MKNSSRIFGKDEKGGTLNYLDIFKVTSIRQRLKEGLVEDSYTM